MAAVSNEGRGWQREIEALNLDLYVFNAVDGSERRMVVKNAGWPAWADESTVYFHRLAEDGWWSIFKANASDTSANQGGVPSIASCMDLHFMCVWFSSFSYSVV